MTTHNHNNKKKSPRISLIAYIKKNRNMLIISVVGFVLGGMFTGIGGVLQNSLKERWADRNPGIDLKLLNSSLGVFQDDGFEKVIQILAYEVSVLDFTKDIKITATFPKSTLVTNCYVTYSIDIRGFKNTQLPSNHVELTLNNSLDVSKRAFVYLWTEKKYVSGDDEKLEYPNIHLEGKLKNEKVIYK